MQEKLVRNEMTPLAIFVDKDESIQRAVDIMRFNEIRHLPVMKRGRLVGLITDGVAKVAALSKWADRLICSDIMLTDPYTVSLNTPVGEVVQKMIEGKIGSTLVGDEQGNIVGIFTTIDALSGVWNPALRNPRILRTTKNVVPQQISNSL